MRVGAAAARLPDFVGFIAATFKVPLLVETTSPVPYVSIPAGRFSARQLLDIAVGQLREYRWEPENGVAHIFQPALARANGNLLNIRIERFYFPKNVADFHFQFRACIGATIQGYGCSGFILDGIVPPGLSSEPLPRLQPFRNVTARTILLSALAANTHFYVLIAFESTHPQRTSDFPFINWFTGSLVPNEPTPMWVQRPQSTR